jgi:hypothetical protein
MNTRFKVFASYNILQYLCDFIHVLIFVTVSKCRKSPKLTNIVTFDRKSTGWDWEITGWGSGVQDNYPLQMDQLSLRNSWLKIKTLGKWARRFFNIIVKNSMIVSKSNIYMLWSFSFPSLNQDTLHGFL